MHRNFGLSPFFFLYHKLGQPFLTGVKKIALLEAGCLMQRLCCGRRWIRTTEGRNQQIYSLPHLATLVFALNDDAKVGIFVVMCKSPLISPMNSW